MQKIYIADMMRLCQMRNAAGLLLLFFPLLAARSSHGATSCEELAKLKLPSVSALAAESVPGGTFNPPYGGSLEKLPAFCRITGVLKPSTDSYIRFEVWLPSSDWNGKYLGVGNGGFAGSIGFNSMGSNLRGGYATAGTDTGHEGEAADASWAYKHPEKIIDFGYRALHLTTETAKSLTQSFYGKPPRHSYFDSCSDGGREALMEAQRFPEDFDGILAGAPANNWTHLLATGVDVSRTVFGNPASYLPSIKLPAITKAVLAACDAQDGVKDGIVNDPQKCHFDPAVLRCQGPESRECLTDPQIASLKKFYAGGASAEGKQIFPGLTPGGEAGDGGWSLWVIGVGPGGSWGATYAENYFRYMIYSDPAWNILKASPDEALRLAEQKTADALNSVNPDLSRFSARGGKLILYHGWNDPAISPLNTIEYYEAVVKKSGVENAASFVRLYMAPGMQHCIGGPGPSMFGQLGTHTAKGPEHGMYSALEDWVEKGSAPGAIIATKYKGGTPPTVEMTRPLCPYPQLAKYSGSGDVNDAASFSCGQ